jgi:hypothetical protein
MFVAGFLFLLYWIFFALLDHRYRNDSETEAPVRSRKGGAIWPKYKAKNVSFRETPIYVGFALFGFPMYVLSVVLLDAVVVLAQVGPLAA